MGWDMENSKGGASASLQGKNSSRRADHRFHNRGGQRIPVGNQVCRNLFGPVDHDLLQQDLQQLLQNSLDLAMQKWNFDFVRDTPSDGMLQWEKLSCKEVPAFYRSQRIGANQNMHSTMAELQSCCHRIALIEKNEASDPTRQE